MLLEPSNYKNRIMVKLYISTQMPIYGLMNFTFSIQKLILIFLVFGFCSVPIEAQKLVKGSVTDIYGEPLIGVNISIPGTYRGTISDIDGNYSIEINQEEQLEFSYTGFETEHIEMVKEMEDVVMVESRFVIDDVIIVGYYKIEKGYGCVLRCCVYSVDASIVTEKKYNKDVGKKSKVSKVFPNPFVSKINVKVSSEFSDDFLIRITTIEGKILHQQLNCKNLENELVSVDLSSMPIGAYVIQVMDSWGLYQSEVIVKIEN
jgi:hypothetical protein